ncbi:twin-arginine translocation signal domain-containing protein [Nodosilinea sp. LEGE 07298]|nr:twin-arginine translocation signal domain-containing protein [Nodosilinea sp. LEGE 07298]
MPRIRRRHFLYLTAGAGLAAVAASCQTSSTTDTAFDPTTASWEDI